MLEEHTGWQLLDVVGVSAPTPAGDWLKAATALRRLAKGLGPLLDAHPPKKPRPNRGAKRGG